MHCSLSALRQNPQPTPAAFISWNPGCWIQYYDDTSAKDPAKAFSARSFNAAVARRKQADRCAVCFSLQAFGKARTKDELLCFRNLGIDVDLIPAAERHAITSGELDRRKEAYLANCLLPFPLKSHWLIETRHGFHIIFRVMPQRLAEGIRDAAALNRCLVTMLHGDGNAALLTQVLRIPGTYQFKNPDVPFLCRLLLDNASTIAPYPLHIVQGVLEAWEVFHDTGEGIETARHTDAPHQPRPWLDRLKGVPQGQRNASAAAIVGGIVGRLPDYLWETAGWGGLKEWNRRNTVPLPERELRSVFQNIARREYAKRQRSDRPIGRDKRDGMRVHVGVQIETNGTVSVPRLRAASNHISTCLPPSAADSGSERACHNSPQQTIPGGCHSQTPTPPFHFPSTHAEHP